MAFSVNDRVSVTDQSSLSRGQLGTVVGEQDDLIKVRIDGQQSTQSRLFSEDQLVSSTLPCPVDY